MINKPYFLGPAQTPINPEHEPEDIPATETVPENLRAIIAAGNWQGMSSAPTNKPIMAVAHAGSDPYFLGEGKLTLYGAHVEGLGAVDDGVHIVEWGGGFDDRTYEEPNAGCLSDWWFVAGSDFELVANPIAWLPIPGVDYSEEKDTP